MPCILKISKETIPLINQNNQNNNQENTDLVIETSDFSSISNKGNKDTTNNNNLQNHTSKLEVQIPLKSSDFYKDYTEYPNILALLAKIEENVPIEPSSYKQAILDKNWFLSIGDEVKELYKLYTWTIMPLPKDKDALGGR